MTALALKRAQFLTKISLGAVLLLCGALLTIGWLQTQHIKGVIESGGSAQAEVTRMRHAAASILDLARVRAALSQLVVASIDVETSSRGERANKVQLVEEAHGRLFDALDFLYVRWETFDKGIPLEEHKSSARQYSSAMVSTIEIGDALIQAGTENILEDQKDLSEALDYAMAQATNYYDAQKEVHVIAVSANEELLNTMASAMQALLLVMSLIAFAAVWLWRAEVVAREKRKIAEQEANFLAFNDALTELPNRSRFYAEIDRLLNQKLDLTVFIIDLDEFKQVNDTLGHAAGDKLLCEVAARLQKAFKSGGGIAARIGGDEFAAILPGKRAQEELDDFCLKLFSSCRESVFHLGREISPKLSIGLARSVMVSQGEGPMRDQIMKAADYALYSAKAEGKNTHRYYDHEIAELVENRREMRSAMPQALQQDEFYVEFQPQVRLDTFEPAGFEALVRWNRDGQRIPPGVFIGIAEESGFIVDLDFWVLKRAIRTVSSWPTNGGQPLTISVNMSAVHFANDGFVNAIARILNDTGFPAERLILEITESVVIDDWEKTREILERLSKIGVEVALDDFGTGYSSMSYLRKLEVSEVKIDRAFITDIETSEETRMIFDSIVDLVRGLGMRLVVEGIETEEQSEILKGLGGQYGQGFYFGRPMPEKDALTWLEERMPAANLNPDAETFETPRTSLAG